MVARDLASDLPVALKRWAQTDPVMERLARARPPRALPRPRRSAFASLVLSLLQQQVSVAAGHSIAKRVIASCGGRITPKAILAQSPTRLRAAGVSRQKRSYIRDLARRATRGDLDFRALARRSDAEVLERLTRVRGVGTWTAKMFLMFHLRRPDVVAPEDLGLRLAASRAYGVPLTRAAGFLETQHEAWRPYGSLACLTLWTHKDA